MPIKFNVNTKIKIMGKEYSRPDEMPPEVRAVYDKAVASNSVKTQATNARINFNGQTYNSLEEMPEDVRKIYDSVMNAVDQNHDGIPDVIQTAGQFSSPYQPVSTEKELGNNIETQSGNKELLLKITLIAVLVLLAGAAFLFLFLSH